MKTLNSLLLSIFVLFQANAQTVWVIEPAHSSIQFEVPHLTISTVTGYFTSFSGTATTNGDDFENARLNAVIDVSSITTHNLERDKHLRDDDFFNVNKYPTMNFKNSSFSRNEDGTFRIDGDLTIKDVTRPITLQADYAGLILLDKQKKAGFTAKGTINRFDYGLQWNDVLDNGGLIVGEDVDFILNITFLQQ
ncbi:MAG: YceI family protein [Candidatus Cyclobacteriaceae bacterium M2_1C_046]